MTVATVVGARPQFIKAVLVSKALKRASLHEVLIHTGQHYDAEMSDVFFQQLGLPPPQIHLGVGSGSHGRQTAAMLERIEEALERVSPRLVIVYGDTNSTLAGALAAAKLRLPVAHVEAGLRSFNRRMPEEINRVLSDHISDLLFCPSRIAVENLRGEGVVRGVHLIGDVMHDALLTFSPRCEAAASEVAFRGVPLEPFALATVHRAENTDNEERLRALFQGLERLAERLAVVAPLHPRTVRALEFAGIKPLKLNVLPPLGYLDLLRLLKRCAVVLTDSGGMQKEAYWLRKPCLTLRTETEWVETVKSGWNRLVDILSPDWWELALDPVIPAEHPELYGDGRAALRVASICADLLRSRP